jgi:hypothetical protein
VVTGSDCLPLPTSSSDPTVVPTARPEVGARLPQSGHRAGTRREVEIVVRRGLTSREREEAVALLERVLAEVEAGRLDADRAAPVLAAVRGALLGLGSRSSPSSRLERPVSTLHLGPSRPISCLTTAAPARGRPSSGTSPQ